eukprot:7256782-Prymnesium_polylepis.1
MSDPRAPDSLACRTMPNYEIDAIDGRLSLRCTLTEDEVRRDFGKLCQMPRGGAGGMIDDKPWDVARSTSSSDPPPVEKKLFRLRLPHTGQLLAEYCHWESRAHTPTDRNPSAFQLLARKGTTV